MSILPCLDASVSAPISEIGDEAVSLESTLHQLTLHDCQVDLQAPAQVVADALDHDPLLPGIVVRREAEFLGVISRRRFRELTSRRYGLEIFLTRPVEVLYQFASAEGLVLPVTTLVVEAAQMALQRSPSLLYEPIVVEVASQDYRLLDTHHLLVAHSQIHVLAMQQLQEQTRSQMIQTEKMASLGQMVAGVAHEILNPVNFICGNIKHLANYSQDLMDLVDAYEATPEQPEAIASFKEDIEFEFLAQDLPRLLSSVTLGAERLRKIVNSLRNFSHMDESQLRPTDLHECIESTLLILNSRLKKEGQIEVIRQYGDLPTVPCYSGQLSQVFMNLLSNAIDALSEKHALVSSNGTGQGWHPHIQITTRVQPRLSDPHDAPPKLWVAVCISDNGLGIPEGIQARIFDTFFTTKAVGKGTGLGLAITHQIVTQKHRGHLNFWSRSATDGALPDQTGTTFEILLPLG